MNLQGTVQVSLPPAPSAGATVELFNSVKAFGAGMMGPLQIQRIRLDFAGMDQPSAASGLVGYKSPDGGTTWYQCAFSLTGSGNTLPQTVAKDTGTDSTSYDIFIGSARDVKFLFTASGTGPTIWPKSCTLQAGPPQSSL